jgi:hypothetical protein
MPYCLWPGHSGYSLNIDQREQVLEHERVVRFGMVARDTDVFVHIERHHILPDQYGLTAFSRNAA